MVRGDDEERPGEVDRREVDPGYRPRPGDEVVEPLFGGLYGAAGEERSEAEVVEEEPADGVRASRIGRVLKRVWSFWRR